MKFTRRTMLQGAAGLTVLGSACLPSIDESDDDESDNMTLEDTRPVVLRSNATITANSDQEVPAAQLMNASGEPLEIHELIFSLRPTDANIAAVGLPGLYVSGGAFAVSLTVKDATDFGYSLTANPVPLWSFGHARQLGQEQPPQTMMDDFQYESSGTGSFSVAVFPWKLDHPLYLPPGARLVPSVRSLGAFNGDVEFGISAIGKIYPNSPPSKASYKIPWVSTYLSKAFEPAEVSNDSSKDQDLWNPFANNVQIERWIGRMHLFTTGSIGFSSLSQQAFVNDTSGLGVFGTFQDNIFNNAYYSSVFKVRLRDSMGNPLVRNKTLFRNVFDSQTRAWEARQILPSRQFHKVDIFKEAGSNGPEINSRAQVSVTSVGWREVSWKKV